MYRGFVLFVCVAVLSVCGPLSGLHVHEYATHDHAEHHHAPAGHSHAAGGDHHREDAVPSSSTPHLESCEPGAHAVSFAFTCVTPDAPLVALSVELAFATTVRPPPARSALLDLSDVRAHSPPRLTDAPLRAPPLVSPA